MEKDHHFSILKMVYTDTGERPASVCIALAALFGVIAYAAWLRGDVMALGFAAAGGCNIGMLGMRSAGRNP